MDWRAATPEEAERLAAQEAEAARAADLRRQVAALRYRLSREGVAEGLGEAPRGEVLYANRRSEAVGYTETLILADDGRLWRVTYDGTDGGTWGAYNLGWNTRGVCMVPTADELDALRQIATVDGVEQR